MLLLFFLIRQTEYMPNHSYHILALDPLTSYNTLVDQHVSVPTQYGIVLYQNYKIPQQRKTLLSHFSAPVVSLTLSNIYICVVKCHISLDQQCTDTVSPSNRHVSSLVSPPLAERVRKLPRGDGLLGEDRQGD